MKYVDRYNYDKAEITSLLKSNKSADIIKALVTTVFASENYELSVSLISQYLDHSDETIQSQASNLIGHIFRIFKRLDLHHLTFLEEGISNNHCENEESLEDAWIFYLRDTNKLNEFQVSHPLLYNYWLCNSIVNEYLETDPEKGKAILKSKLELTQFNNQILKDKVFSSIEHIDLFN